MSHERGSAIRTVGDAQHCHSSSFIDHEYYVSASSLVLSSGLCRTSSGKAFTPWRKILCHGVKITPRHKNLAGGGDFRGQAPNLVELPTPPSLRQQTSSLSG